MAKLRSTGIVMRSIVSPALGLSVAALIAAGAASTGCSPAVTTTGEIPTNPEKIGPVGSVGLAPWSPPLATSSPPQPTASGTSSAAATPSVASTLPVVAATVRPVGSAAPRIHPPVDLPRPGTTATDETPMPGPVLTPHKVGIVAAPGFGSNGALALRPTEARPTRPTRRATDPDARPIRRGRLV